jgi:hypothetical protein
MQDSYISFFIEKKKSYSQKKEEERVVRHKMIKLHELLCGQVIFL